MPLRLGPLLWHYWEYALLPPEEIQEWHKDNGHSWPFDHQLPTYDCSAVPFLILCCSVNRCWSELFIRTVSILCLHYAAVRWRCVCGGGYGLQWSYRCFSSVHSWMLRMDRHLAQFMLSRCWIRSCDMQWPAQVGGQAHAGKSFLAADRWGASSAFHFPHTSSWQKLTRTQRAVWPHSLQKTVFCKAFSCSCTFLGESTMQADILCILWT